MAKESDNQELSSETTKIKDNKSGQNSSNVIRVNRETFTTTLNNVIDKKNADFGQRSSNKKSTGRSARGGVKHKKGKKLNDTTASKNEISEISEQTSAKAPSMNQKRLDEIVTTLRTSPETEFMKAMREARTSAVEKYIEDLSQKKKRHPMLQNEGKFQLLTEALRTVNGQKTSLICVDLEAFEFNTKIVTEVGISIYDPVKEATSLFPSIVNIHIILEETKHLRNGSFVHDHKDNFLGGNSLMLKQSVAVDFIQTLFNYYFKDRKEMGYETAFVAHNGSGDIRWLNQLGVQTPEKFKLLDTQNIHAASHGQNGNSLGALLKRCHVPHSFLHNAGNDAYFTLVALLKITDPQFRITHRFDEAEEDERYNELLKEEEIELKNQRSRPKKISRPRKKLKSHEFAPYLKFSNYQDALMKTFRNF